MARQFLSIDIFENAISNQGVENLCSEIDGSLSNFSCLNECGLFTEGLNKIKDASSIIQGGITSLKRILEEHKENIVDGENHLSRKIDNLDDANIDESMQDIDNNSNIVKVEYNGTSTTGIASQIYENLVATGMDEETAYDEAMKHVRTLIDDGTTTVNGVTYEINIENKENIVSEEVKEQLESARGAGGPSGIIAPYERRDETASVPSEQTTSTETAQVLTNELGDSDVSIDFEKLYKEAEKKEAISEELHTIDETEENEFTSNYINKNQKMWVPKK